MDFSTLLQSKFEKERILRKRLTAQAVLALPYISQQDFEKKFGTEILNDTHTIWRDGRIDVLKSEIKIPLTDDEWNLARSIIQGINPLNKPSLLNTILPFKLGAALKGLERQIALLDVQQEKVALQIPPGPQRIRGLAGTGKTVLLAMKAANIHQHYPDKKLLFTFNTQSLYNQAKNLITKFYRVYSDTDPDWEKLHIRHAWGGQNRLGVYSDLSARQGVQPLDLRSAKKFGYKSSFQACCENALKYRIQAEYDYILVDEAQDFPKEFFQILYKLCEEPKRLYWAYDELQTLSSIDLPRLEDQFGVDNDGKPLVTLDEKDYPGKIEKDFVLHRSYRCPQDVLMLAHAIGLGLYKPGLPVQMLDKQDSWEALGYEIEQGKLEKGQEIVIYRPPENSPNKIREIYKGSENILTEA